MAITAQQVVSRVQQQIGAGWKNPSVDTFLAGSPDTNVTGVVTTFAPGIDVMRKAVAAGRNMIISREAPFWARNTAGGRGGGGGGRAGGRGGSGGGRAGAGAGNGPEPTPTEKFKRDYIAANNLVVWRFFDNWNARPQDGQLLALARTLGWEKSYKPSGGQPWATDNGYFALAPTTLKDAATSIKKSLKTKSIRIVGDPATKVTKAALSHGMYFVPDIEKHLTEPGVDLFVIGEPVEWEAMPYFADLVSSGQKKGMIIMGQEASEEPGSGEVASWLKTFINEVPVEWIPTGEPAWMPY
jgi:putative NIF3 family GTP cyclohydrolase 1 type 2